MFVVRRHFPLWLYDSLKPLHCLSPYPLYPGMRFTPSISEKITSSLVNFSKDASVPLFPCFSGCLFAGANAFGGNKGTWSRPLAVSPTGAAVGLRAGCFGADPRLYLRGSVRVPEHMGLPVCLCSPRHESPARFKNENISKV